MARTYAVLAQSSTPSSSSNYLPSPPYSYKTPWDGSEKSEKPPLVENDEGLRALDAYLEDDDWEARERAAGRGPSSALGSSSSTAGTSRRWR